MSNEIDHGKRRFLGLCGAGLLGLGATAAGIRLATPAAASVPNPFYPESIARFPIAITNGVNVRSYPVVPEPPAIRIPRSSYWNNILPWDQIASVNGTSLNGARVFVIENAPTVRGENTDNDYEEQFRPYDTWIKLSIKQRRQIYPSFYFVSYSIGQTRDFVRRVGGGSQLKVEGLEHNPDGDSYILLGGESIRVTDIGKVTVYPEANSLGEVWAARMADKLDGKIPLEYEQKFAEVMVVPAGVSLDHVRMQREAGRTVSLTEYPRIFTPEEMKGKILGSVKFNTRIKSVILTENLLDGIFRRRDLFGDIIDASGRNLEIPPNKILTINADNLLRPDSPLVSLYT